MHHGKTVLPEHGAVTARMRQMYTEMLGYSAAVRRALEIAALPKVQWKGSTLHTLRCNGDYGKGPHMQHLPEYVLWSLIALENYRCPYHKS